MILLGQFDKNTLPLPILCEMLPNRIHSYVCCSTEHKKHRPKFSTVVSSRIFKCFARELSHMRSHKSSSKSSLNKNIPYLVTFPFTIINPVFEV